MKSFGEILVAEDHPIILTLYTKALHKHGFAHHSANSPQSALEIMRRKDIKHLLTDGNGWNEVIQEGIKLNCSVVIQTGEVWSHRHHGVPVIEKTQGVIFVIDNFLRISGLIQ
ncbi:hypothetical protein K9M47_04545 [Candidatus Gracilibacteria bacterium]|nr:hypothetical protein [Candidatus Gracilibacteria bacterium]MCF7898953.1 hypothetical protein [Candidatus Paceibacterota bacterium]